jgi:hypothetical protein
MRFALKRLTLDNVANFVEHCPPELILQLCEDVQNLPATGDDPAREDGVIFAADYTDSRLSDEEHAALRAESDRRYREGVRVFRSHFSDRAR